jgi:hypothetical protein
LDTREFMPDHKLVQVTAPHYCAALITDGSICIDAAPILQWAVGKTEQELAAYFKRKRYKVTALKISRT